MHDYARLRMTIHLSVGKHASAPAEGRPATRGAEAVPTAQCPCPVPLRVVLDRVAMSPWPLRTWSRWVSERVPHRGGRV